MRSALVIRRILARCTHRLAVVTTLMGMAFAQSGCQHRAGGRDFADSGLTAATADAVSQSYAYDFCQVKGPIPDVTSARPWGAAMVQRGISDLIASPKVKGTIWAAYPVAYRRMTAARDEARCFGVLVSDDPRINLINHHLSDIMTRWLVLETEQCANKGVSGMPAEGLCGTMKRASLQKYDGLSEALDSTAVYISSHLATALAAVVVDDDFWDAFPDNATHRGTRSLDFVLGARMKWVRRYKPSYDLFNPFLAENLETVGDALKEAGFVKGSTLNLTIYMAKILKCKAVLFGSIRDRAFDAALAYTEDPLLVRHPMLKVKESGYVLNYGQFNFNAPLPKSIRDLEVFAVTAVANPLSLKIYHDVLGGVKIEELEGVDPNDCSQ